MNNYTGDNIILIMQIILTFNSILIFINTLSFI